MMKISVRLSSDDVKKVVTAFSGRWSRYRSSYGTIRAAESVGEFEVIVSGGVLIGDRGDFICIDEITFNCWVEDSFNFQRFYTHVTKTFDP